MSAKVVVDGLRNEPIARADLVECLTPFLDLMGIDLADFESMHVSGTHVRLKVRVRNKRGRRLPDSWAHVVTRVLDDDIEDGES